MKLCSNGLTEATQQQLDGIDDEDPPSMGGAMTFLLGCYTSTIRLWQAQLELFRES
jgi:hypothetical protein